MLSGSFKHDRSGPRARRRAGKFPHAPSRILNRYQIWASSGFPSSFECPAMSDTEPRPARPARAEASPPRGVIRPFPPGVLALFVLGLDGGKPHAPAAPAPSGATAPDRG